MSVPLLHMGQCPSRVLSALGQGWDWLGHVWHHMIPARFCYPFKGHASTTTTRVVVVHSCLCQALIKHKWSASLADVGLHSKSSHVAWEQNCVGLAPQSGQTSLRVVRNKILPHLNIVIKLFARFLKKEKLILWLIIGNMYWGNI